MSRVSYPDWISEIVDWQHIYKRPEERMILAVQIAERNISADGGPFGAVITDNLGHIIAVGWNQVVMCCDSTAHAELLAIRHAQQKLRVFNFKQSRYITELYCSASPCIQCFGAIWWAGLDVVYASATKEDVEAIGFQEGPVTEEMWHELKQQKGTLFFPNFCRTRQSLSVLEAYRERGLIY